IEVIAVHTLGGREGKQKWVKFVNEHKLYNWINCWSPYDYQYKTKYDVYASPTIYLLNKNKEIIAKRIGVEQIEEIIEFEKNKKAKN
ncbi:MAG: DUF5106 domain-containing protein, partial [Bacteroidales bacterium]|nr:DUF5106 domain-containing protein [Bacteroidales bacterium]